MKTAKVVGVRDVGPGPATRPCEAQDDAASAARMDRMADLLRRYPAIDAEAEAELLAFLRKGRHLEIGLVGAREGMAPRIMQVRRDHSAHFRPTMLQMLGFVALVLGPLAALAWACLR